MEEEIIYDIQREGPIETTLHLLIRGPGLELHFPEIGLSITGTGSFGTGNMVPVRGMCKNGW